MKKNLFYYEYAPPIGGIWIGEANGALTDVFFGAESLDIHAPARRPSVTRPGESKLETGRLRRSDEHTLCETEILAQAAAQLRQYFARERTEFTVPLAPEGTDFQQSVWNGLLRIPYGETRPYSHIASPLKGRQQARAIGMAAGRNPLAIIIPCHRLIGKDGRLTGYAYGLEIKRHLLTLEGSIFA